eukprot:NODE_464_length_8145_cov_0.677977.p4 type:complete len:124 gc:universal NODE_464_length_8145_cov_0.677977:3660-4031(+)
MTDNQGYSVPPVLIFAIVAAIFVLSFATVFTFKHFKAKRAERRKDDEQIQQSIPMATVADSERIPEQEQIISESRKADHKDSNELLPVEQNENRKSIYDTEFYVSKSREPFFRNDSDEEETKQ